MRKNRTGLLLINTGSPDSPYPADVRRYLKQFLSDPMVMDIHPVLRWFLLNLVILPFRPARSAEAYRSIWTDRGSPLLAHGRDFASLLSTELGSGYEVELAMRYGRPSIGSAISKLEKAGIESLSIFPLFPHNASSTVGTCTSEAIRHAARILSPGKIRVVPPFYDYPGFIHSFAESLGEVTARSMPDHILFSFHGLPERHILKADKTGAHCLRQKDCCGSINDRNSGCYRAQCYETVRRITGKLQMEPESYSVSFQSRLGRQEWIKPYTAETIDGLRSQGLETLAVCCPSFVADCLETLEEIGSRARKRFIECGGKDLHLVPSLNSRRSWIEAAAGLVRKSSVDLTLETGT